MTQKTLLDTLCAPAAIDEPEESDFIASDALDEKSEEMFVRNWIAKGAN